MSSIKCPRCELVNFTTESKCKRCETPLKNMEFVPNSETTISTNTFDTAIKPTQPLSGQSNSEPHYLFQKTENSGQQQYRQPANFQPPVNYPPQQANYQYPPQAFQQPSPPQVYPPQYQYPPQPQYVPNNNWAVNQPSFHPMHAPQNSPQVWRRGDQILVPKYTNLPPRCVKCNHPVTQENGGNLIKQKYSWHNPLVYIALISPLIYVIIAACVSERLTFYVPLCNDHLENRSNIGMILAIGMILTICLPIFFGYIGAVGFGLLIGIIGLITVVLVNNYSYRPLRISKIENQYAYLDGADASYLNSLPYC